MVSREAECHKGLCILAFQGRLPVDRFHGDQFFRAELPGEEHFAEGEILGDARVVGRRARKSRALPLRREITTGCLPR